MGAGRRGLPRQNTRELNHTQKMAAGSRDNMYILEWSPTSASLKVLLALMMSKLVIVLGYTSGL